MSLPLVEQVLGADVCYFRADVIWFGFESCCPRGKVAVSRCAVALYQVDDARQPVEHPRQCGRVARIAPDGAYLCDTHLSTIWKCELCQGWLEPGQHPFCSDACRMQWDEEVRAAEQELDEEED